MATRKLHAVHALNRFLWARLSAEGVMKPIGTLTPIVPVEQTPALITAIEAGPGIASTPFIVYNWSLANSSQWQIKTHEIAYAVRAGDATVMRQIINLFEDEFQDEDIAAQRVNAYLRSIPNLTAELKEYHFHNITLSTFGGQMPTDIEGGMNEALITVRAMVTGPEGKGYPL